MALPTLTASPDMPMKCCVEMFAAMEKGDIAVQLEDRAKRSRTSHDIAALVRRHDPDRFLTALFAPPERRRTWWRGTRSSGTTRRDRSSIRRC